MKDLSPGLDHETARIELVTTVIDKQKKDVTAKLFKEYAGWQPLGFLTWEQFCELRYQKPAEEIETTITQRLVTQARAEQPKELAKQGRQNKDYDCNVYSGANQGNSADYLTARIVRDRPDIADDMKHGKYKSVRNCLKSFYNDRFLSN